jgi:hypothetical protein
MRTKIVGRNLAVIIAWLCAAQLSRGQALGPTVEIPTTGNALINIGSVSPTNTNTATAIQDNLTMGRTLSDGKEVIDAKDTKETKNVIEEAKPKFWSWYADVGYTSEYNFRGTDLTPNSDGATYFDAQVTKANFTLGFFGIHQLDDASSPSWSIGEGGGGGTAQGIFPGFNGPGGYTRFPTTTQTEFNELDVFLSYKMSFGPVDVTIGDIGFFIERRAVTFETDVLQPGFHWIIPPTGTRFRTVGPDPTVEDEQFDRAYIRLSTTKISKYITPQITYYQNLASHGSQPTHGGIIFYPPDVNGNRPDNLRPFNERNPEDYGGYLEGRINGNFPITSWMDFDPSAIISVSFRDRVEPGGANPYGGHPLTGFNHAQIGAKLPIHVMRWGGANLYLAPFGNYAYHISNPNAGTNRNEWWGGGEVEFTF